MTESLLIVVAVLVLAILVVSVAVYLKLRSAGGDSRVIDGLASIPVLTADVAHLRDELQRSEQAARTDAQSQRQELAAQLTSQRTELSDTVSKLQTATEGSFGRLSTGLAEQVQLLTTSIGVATTSQTQSLSSLQQAQAAAADSLRNQVVERLEAVTRSQTESASAFREELTRRLDAAATAQQATATVLQTALNEQLAGTRGEITTAVAALSKENSANLSGIAERVSTQLANQGKDSGENMDKLRADVENKLTSIQAAADAKLEQMRATVDEKLSSTLNTRLGESFKLVSDRLEAVQTGLGEMKSLAGNVTDLRRMMTNVKTRGVWGEVQLANLLDQIFTQDQYEANFKPKARGGETVEFALKLPGPEDRDGPVFLPIDSKFPTEDFQRLSEAADTGDVEGVKLAKRALENRIYNCAKDIRDKYIAVPTTTNFAVLFLPTEALYAEVIKIPGLMECLTRDYKVVLQGPATFTAFAMALLMGFRTLAIQKRSADIANLLGAIKSDFSKFADLLGKVEERLDDAKTNVGKARQRSAQIVRKLERVEELPQEHAKLLLPDPSFDPDSVVNE